MDRGFSSLPTELRCSIIAQLLSSYDSLRICTKYVPRPLERTPGRQIIYKSSIPMQIFQLDRRTRTEAIAVLSKSNSKADLRYCSPEFLTDINKLSSSALRDAIHESVIYVQLGTACVPDFKAFRKTFPRLQHMTLEQLGSDYPYGRARTRETDGFSVNKDLIQFLRGDFDAEFERLARGDVDSFFKRQSMDIRGLKLEIPFRFSVPRSQNDIHADLRSKFPGRTLVGYPRLYFSSPYSCVRFNSYWCCVQVFVVIHDESETKIVSKYFSKFEVRNSNSRPTHTPAVSHVPLNEASSLSLQDGFSSHDIQSTINLHMHELIEIQHWGYCGTGLFHAFDGWLNDRYDYTWRAWWFSKHTDVAISIVV